MTSKFAINIPNKIKQPAQCCVHCGKSYKKRINLDKHFTICDLLQQGKNKRILEEDEEIQIPSQKKMFQMLIELGQKYNKLEEKMDELNKWVIKKKKKINVLEWLNANLTPTILFEDIINKIVFTDEDVPFLMENTFNDTLNHIFSKTIYNFNEENINPLFAFAQKANIFYIYSVIDNTKCWTEFSREQLIKFLNKVHMKIIKTFYDWKITKAAEIKESDKFAISCDKTLLKLMTPEFKQESVLSKIKSMMYQKMKTDMKALIEYEFEF
jgi:hypothetical protein